MAAKAKNAPGAKAPKPEPVSEPVPAPVDDGVNPASDPRLSAQERLDAVHRQHEAMHRNPEGRYPL